MLNTKRSFFLLASSVCALSLVNCSDNDELNEGGSGAGAMAGGSAVSGGAGKASAGGGSGGSDGKAGASGEDGGMGQGSDAGDAGEGNASGMGNAGEGGSAGSGGKGGAGGSAGSAGKAGAAGSGGTSGAAGSAGKGGAVGSGGTSGSGGAGGSGGKGGAGGGASGSGGMGGSPSPHQAPILNYAFNEGVGTVAVDSSPSGLNGTLATPAWTANGRTGAGLSLSGGILPTTYVTVPPGIFSNVKSTTIAAWVKLVANVPWSRIFDFGGTGTGANTRFMYLTPDNGAGMLFSTFGGSPAREAMITTGTRLPLNVWKHVAVTVEDGGKRAIFVDGYPAAKATTVDVAPSELEPLSASSWLGKSRFDTDGGLNGVLDDFLVYDRVLSAAEIATLAYPKADYSRLAFDEATGTTSADSSERAVNATLTDATWASGVSGAAVLLSGTTTTAQYITLSNPLAGCTTELTVALWVKQTTAAPWARIFDFGGTNDNFMFLTPSNSDGKLQLNIHPNQLGPGTAVPETVVVSASTYPVDAGWHHVAVVVSASVASLYIDGSVVGNAPTPVTPAVLGGTNEHWLGKSRFPDAYFKGSFDELRISCRALTSDEIKNLAFH